MTSQDFYEKRLANLLSQEQGAGEQLHRAVKRATEAYEGVRARLDADRRKLEGLKDEPVVVVRRGPGPHPTVFHREDRACGWRPSSGERMFMGEGFARGLKGCKSCAWDAKPAPADAA